MRGLVGVAFVAACAMATALGGGTGCTEGNGLGGADMTPPVDMTPPPDLVPPPDLLPPPNCGQIVFCALGCLGGGLGGIGGLGGGGAADMSGANPLGCVLSCGTGASSTDVTDAISLVICAAQNCLSADGGTSGSGTLGILQCLETSCSSQVSACHGLGIGG